MKKVRIQRHLSIGVGDAADDTVLLTQAFVDRGDLAVLTDVDDPRFMLVGRTGSGKTALQIMLRTYQDRAASLDLDDLSLMYIANDGIVNFATEIDVDLDLFFKLIWRHVFLVETLKLRYGPKNESESLRIVDNLRHIFGRRGKAEQRALEYLDKYGSSLWVDTHEKVREITQEFSTDLRAGMRGALGQDKVGIIEAGIGASQALNEKQRVELQKRAQGIVNKVQLAELAQLTKILNEDLLQDTQKRYFLTIDRLDEPWTADSVRYPMIAALLDSARQFNSDVGNAKVIVALREDLIDRVFRYVRRPGYQSEKFETLKHHLRWRREELEGLIDQRLTVQLGHQVGGQEVRLAELLPEKLGYKKQAAIEYFLDRTMLRPRDAIAFANECLYAASGSTSISAAAVGVAEEAYSTRRLEAIRDEWRADFPNIADMVLALKGLPAWFHGQECIDLVINGILAFLDLDEPKITYQDPAREELEKLFNSDRREELFLEYMSLMHRVGVVGVKPATTLSTVWTYQAARVTRISVEDRFEIHPSLWRVLGTKVHPKQLRRRD